MREKGEGERERDRERERRGRQSERKREREREREISISTNIVSFSLLFQNECETDTVKWEKSYAFVKNTKYTVDKGGKGGCSSL